MATGNPATATDNRIMVIGCKGTCGVSRPASVASLTTTAQWAALTPGTWPSTAAAPAAADPIRYVNHVGEYADTNLVSADHPTLAPHRCYHKCVATPCIGAGCTVCTGVLPGYDAPGGNALCADQATCETLCTGLGAACLSIDMHRHRPRCYLNGVDRGTASAVRQDPEYKLVVKAIEEGASAVSNEAVHITRRLADGTSTASVLRFTGLRFNSIGRYKVCFCDSALNGAACTERSHFPIEVGTIHVSGVSCLLTEVKLRRGECVSQFHGGLRCYPKGMAVVAV